MCALSFPLRQFQPQLDSVNAFIAAAPQLNEWPLSGALLRSEQAESPPWLPILPVVACAAAGGEPAAAVPVAAAWLALRKAAHLIDAVQDGDELPLELDSPKAALNCALALVFGGFRIAADLRPPKIAARVTAVFAEGGFDSAHGYHLSQAEKRLEDDLDDQLEGYWRETLLKSGSIYRVATLAGAHAAGSPLKKTLDALDEYGNALGVMLQILDDCRDRGVEASGGSEHRLPSIAAIHAPGGKGATVAHLARLLSPILLAWKQRGQAQLARLQPSPAVDLLAEVLEAVTTAEADGQTTHVP